MGICAYDLDRRRLCRTSTYVMNKKNQTKNYYDLFYFYCIYGMILLSAFRFCVLSMPACTGAYVPSIRFIFMCTEHGLCGFSHLSRLLISFPSTILLFIKIADAVDTIVCVRFFFFIYLLSDRLLHAVVLASKLNFHWKSGWFMILFQTVNFNGAFFLNQLGRPMTEFKNK